MILEGKVIKIGIHDIIVAVASGLTLQGSRVYGYFDPDMHYIWLDAALQESHAQEILIHEILHACWWYSQLGAKADEETAVSHLAPALSAVLVFNPWISRWLIGEDYLER